MVIMAGMWTVRYWALLLVVGAFLPTACGGGSEPTPSPTRAASPSPTTVLAPVPTSTPTPTSKATPTPALTPTPTPTATRTAAPTSTSAPTSTPTATSISTPTPSPTPAPVAGDFVTKWGTKGFADGQLESPSGIALDGASNVYVADTNNDRVQVFSSAGDFLRKWGASGVADRLFNRPLGIVVDATTTKGRHRPHLSESSADRRVPRPSPLVLTPRPLRIGGFGLKRDSRLKGTGQ